MCCIYLKATRTNALSHTMCSEPKLSGKTVREREEKWLAMFQKWDKFIENKAKRNKVCETYLCVALCVLSCL